ncbi:MAG: hypothetical protein H6709_00920 [Kofleriaceae bacterium]|nr:hypothetical protein [Myxococcales bacterium]MCB9558816.1 hypothetical protein [Kofleriaceae bacterium]MCB9570629.1 hypothetical protein [Kofleriaceae bacterium]
MHGIDTSELLRQGIVAGLDRWAARDGNTAEALYWVLRLQLAETGLDNGTSPGDVMARVPAEGRDEVTRRFRGATAYFDDIRYAALAPVTQVWGTVVNSMRVAADSNRVTPGQRQVFDVPAEQVVKLFRALRSDVDVADSLHRAFGAMPAPECQAMAALLNVDLDRSPSRSSGDSELDVETMVRLVRLLDHEGPMTPEEQAYLESITPTTLVDAVFSGLRSRG